jgi:hypothetical protein
VLKVNIMKIKNKVNKIELHFNLIKNKEFSINIILDNINKIIIIKA